MNHREFISKLDEQRITDAIAEAEKKTSGEIRVYVSHKEQHDAFAFATKRFEELGMTRTRERNAVLIYIVPRTQEFAVIGDSGIHEKCGHELWTEVVAGMSDLMKTGRFTDAITGAIGRLADALAKHFPRRPDDQNELPNAVVRE